MDQTPYSVLGVNSSVKQEDLKGVYRELIQKWHPDKFETATDDAKEEARKKFDFIQEAYNLLKHPERRRLYDDTGYIDPPEGKIRSSVQTMLRTLINNYLSRGEEIFTLNVVDEINDYCASHIIVCKKHIKDLKGKKRFLVRVIQKFKKKSSLKVDFLSNIFIGEMNALDISINTQLESILIFSQTKSVISAYEFDFMKVLEGREFNSSSTSISLGNIFELAGVTTSAEN